MGKRTTEGKVNPTWQRVCSSDELTFDDPKAITIKGREIGIFRTKEGLFAIDNICSHEYAHLTGGFVESTVVECPLHEAKFCLKTGGCLQGPAVAPVDTFQVKESDASIVVWI
jgi:3-phenylpropionate/trans-cinnamate dioxygenase ferredoxin subunit